MVRQSFRFRAGTGPRNASHQVTHQQAESSQIKSSEHWAGSTVMGVFSSFSFSLCLSVMISGRRYPSTISTMMKKCDLSFILPPDDGEMKLELLRAMM